MAKNDENRKIRVNEIPIVSFVGLLWRFIWEFLILLIYAFCNFPHSNSHRLNVFSLGYTDILDASDNRFQAGSFQIRLDSNYTLIDGKHHIPKCFREKIIF
jgi:hypothetical protein